MSLITRDYDLFRIKPSNRPIDGQHVKRLKRSLEAKNRMNDFPVIVNRNMEVIDGQHRLEACKEMGIPVHYKIVDDLIDDDMVRLNVASKRWSYNDVLNYYVSQGNKEYMRLNNLIQRTGITFSMAVALHYTQRGSIYSKLADGTYLYDPTLDYYDFDLLRETLAILRNYKVNPYTLKNKKFIKAFFKMVSHELFNKNIWIERIHTFHYKLTPSVNEAEFLKKLLEIYNHGMKKNILAFEEQN